MFIFYNNILFSFYNNAFSYNIILHFIILYNNLFSASITTCLVVVAALGEALCPVIVGNVSSCFYFLHLITFSFTYTHFMIVTVVNSQIDNADFNGRGRTTAKDDTENKGQQEQI